MVMKCDRRVLFAIPAVAFAGLAGWLLLPSLARTAPPELTLNLAKTDTADDALPPEEAPSPSEAVDIDNVSLSRQSFRRGGLGSQALFTFMVRNANDYDIKNVELLCAFKSRDGRYTTERRKMLADTIGMKSRKAFPMTLVGHVNIRASLAKCSLVTASRA